MEGEMPITYSNPRMHAEIQNWPLGGKTRGFAVFDVEQTKGRGERGMRVTRKDSERFFSAPKRLTYARKCRIVDGDDGRTYLLSLTMSGHISVSRSDMQLNEEAIFPTDPRYADMRAMFGLPEETSLTGRHYTAGGVRYQIVEEPIHAPLTVIVENPAGERHWVDRALIEKVAEP